jgi:hypothetical protein
MLSNEQLIALAKKNPENKKLQEDVAIAQRMESDPEFRAQRRAEFQRETLEGAKFAPFRIAGGVVDVANLPGQALGIAPEKPFLGSDYMIDKYATGIEALGGSYRRPTGSGAELAGDIIGSTLNVAGAVKGLSRLSTIARGSGIEKRGTGAAQMQEPVETVKAYKLFEKDPETGKLYPLFVEAGNEVPVGVWRDAIFPETVFTSTNGKKYVPSQKWTGKPGTGDSIPIPNDATRDMLIDAGYLPKGSRAKSVKAVALRPGWHAGDNPVASHIGPQALVDGQKLKVRGENQVWAEVELPADVDWQSIANSNASTTKGGALNVQEAQITEELPMGGYYRYKTNPNMDGNWMISGQMKVNRVLDDAEVAELNEAAGVQDLPRLSQLMSENPPPVMKKAKGGHVDLRSGIGDMFRLYS